VCVCSSLSHPACKSHFSVPCLVKCGLSGSATCFKLSHNSTILEKISVLYVVCRTVGPQLRLKRFLHTVKTSASFFNFQYPFASVKSSSSCLRLLPLLPITYIPLIFPSIMCFRRQFLRRLWPIQLAFFILLDKCIEHKMCDLSFSFSLNFCLKRFPLWEELSEILSQMYLNLQLSTRHSYRILMNLLKILE
jgi:hypothetical protein